MGCEKQREVKESIENRQAKSLSSAKYEKDQARREVEREKGSGAILEGIQALRAHDSRSVFILANRNRTSGNHVEDSEIRDRGRQGHDQESATETDGVGVIDLILVFDSSFGRLGAGDDHRDEIIEDQGGEDLLDLEAAPDTVRMVEGDAILEEEERGFDTPAAMIEVFKVSLREL